MYKNLPLVGAIGLFFIAPAVASTSSTSAPVIGAAGAFYSLPNATYQPSPNVIYEVVFALTQPVEEPTKVNPGLERVARTVNLYASAGIPLSHLKFVAVASGSATAMMLDDAHYRLEFKVSNPNLEVIQQLRRAGVGMVACGQAVIEHHFQNEWLAKGVTVSLSALTTITELEQEGYGLLPL